MYELSWLLQLSKQEVEMFLLALTPPPPSPAPARPLTRLSSLPKYMRALYAW